VRLVFLPQERQCDIIALGLRVDTGPVGEQAPVKRVGRLEEKRLIQALIIQYVVMGPFNSCGRARWKYSPDVFGPIESTLKAAASSGVKSNKAILMLGLFRRPKGCEGGSHEVLWIPGPHEIASPGTGAGGWTGAGIYLPVDLNMSR
jgi:hypothetical protein